MSVNGQSWEVHKFYYTWPTKRLANPILFSLCFGDSSGLMRDEMRRTFTIRHSVVLSMPTFAAVDLVVCRRRGCTFSILASAVATSCFFFLPTHPLFLLDRSDLLLQVLLTVLRCKRKSLASLVLLPRTSFRCARGHRGADDILALFARQLRRSSSPHPVKSQSELPRHAQNKANYHWLRNLFFTQLLAPF